MKIGVDYYPEHWDRKELEPHAKLMAEAGFNLVRLAEFAWHQLEPHEGRIEFGWLDDAIASLRKHDIKVILGTPTAAPPPWLVFKYPDALNVDPNGGRAQAGGRRHYCYTSPRYRELSRRIVTAMAQHYSDHPSVVGWQTDNEIGGPKCWCGQCEAAFRAWLKERYSSLDDLNRSWGTFFWGQIYNDWEEIPLPKPRVASHSPAIRLEHSRFHSAQVISYHDQQVEILRRLCPRHFITHNCMGFYDEVDYFELGKNLDLIAWDNYPGNKWGSGNRTAAAADYMRSLKHKPFMVMEQRAGLTGWLEIYQSGDSPGQLRLWSYQAVAHGADSLLYFRWRTCRFGTEQYWHGVLDHHGRPGRRYQELARVGREFAALGDSIVGAQYEAPIGILMDPDSRWALEIQKGNPAFDYLRVAGEYHAAFSYFHLGVEYYHPKDDFGIARILIAPALFLADESIAARLEEYVRAGGLLVLTFRSGAKDRYGAIVNDRLPGLLAPIAGAYVEEYDCPVDNETFGIETSAPMPKRKFRAGVWCDQLRLNGARAIARYTDGPFKGSPAAAVNGHGRGQAVLVGFMGDRGFHRHLAEWLLKQRDLKTGISPGESVEVTLRVKGRDLFYFVLNHAGTAQRVSMPPGATYRNLLTGRKHGRGISLAPFDVMLLSPVKP